ncbi:transglutaminase-like domain-containing protein [Pseudobacteroides cellulosolvens]|uniref:Transglutaminase domain-containing protein n=1 Tax=Pseudobacteroides cellulosolvens ATCC 35603 = DSM 2933 TaxID=398512 RepID=A0A0L6JX66_9FIRM|nr:transglutaminase-like domain-containing protein [Pseudobacteroides cellulosolvens]KNY30037.1 transglutaminase domain-containing protein [Pseudobacteroides cellulosolvens ATCC 35603 = DSM 2933]
MNFSNIKNILKDNRFKALLLALVTLVSALLIISSINMLSFTYMGESKKTADSGSGKDNKNSPGNNNSNNQENNESRQNDGQADDKNDHKLEEDEAEGDNRDWDNEGMDRENRDFNFDQPNNSHENNGETQDPESKSSENGQDGERPDEDNPRDSEGEGNERDDGYSGGYTIPDELRNRLKNQRPEFNIDLSKDDSLPKGRYFGDGDSYSISNAKKGNHVPLFEILGKLDSPFIKMTVQDTYSGSKWYSNPEKTAKVYKYNENNNDEENSCKIKFINPAKGFIPMPVNMQSVKVPVLGLLNYPDEGVFYSDFLINDYYEVFLKNEMPDRYVLENSDIDPRFLYNTDSLGKLNSGVEELVEGLETPYEKIEAIANYLKFNFTKGTVKNRAREDALYRFLNDRKGSQLDFVSTFVTLLRCADIPARLVTGYRADPSAEYQIVYADQMCVYPEVCFLGYGWVPVDYFAQINPIDPPKPSITHITKLNETALKGEGFNVAGTVKDVAGKALNGQTVLIYLKKDKSEECLSYDKAIVKNGVFDIDCILKENIDVGSYQVVARMLADSTYKESDSDPELKVLAETDMSIAQPKITDNGSKLVIDASLFERLSKKPVSDGEVEISYTNIAHDSDKEMGLVSVKGEVQAGRFVTSVDISKTVKPEGNYIFFSRYLGVLTGKYIGTDYYIPSTGEVDVNLTIIYWWRIIITLFILICLAVLIIGFVLLRRKRRLAAVSAYGNGLDYFNNKYRTEDNVNIEELKIRFPDIVPEFEDVWGINEPFRVIFYDSYGNFDELDMVFDKKGLKRISVLPDSGGRANISRNIRIVCYGEEVLVLGKRLNDILYNKFGLMPKRLTPREIIKYLQSFQKSNAINGYTDSNIEDLILILEKAAYSSDEVRREDYERFYKFVSSL